MPFCVVQTRKTKNSKPALTIVPSKWVSNGNVYWPLSNLITLSANGNSEPDKLTWRTQKCKVVGRAGSYKSAEETVRKLENVTDSEDAAQTSLGTRAHPGKKHQKYQSKTYQLAPPRSDLTKPSCSYRPSSASEIVSNSATREVTTSSSIPLASLAKNELPVTSVELRSTTSWTETPNAPDSNSGKRAEIEQHITDDSQLHQQVMNIADDIPAHIDQQEQDQANELGLTMSGPLQIIQSSDGRQFVRLLNGCYMEVMPEQPMPEPIINLAETNTTADPNNSQSITLKDIGERLTRIESCLQKVTLFMADVSKYMKMTTEPSTTTRPVKRRRENFEEVEMLFPINDDEMLQSLENRLNDQVFSDKLLRYVSCRYELNGKRDGRTFFKILVREMIAPKVLLPYSWMGNSRKISHDLEPNKGFKKSFRNIVKFFENVTCEADCTFSNEGVEKAFSDHLRQKHTEMKRFLTGAERRMPSSRVRPRKVKSQLMETEKDENLDYSEDATNTTSNDSENNEDSNNSSV